jgi:hypothetical protein
MGGNRSFPVMGVMDDRRHRLMNLAQDAAKGAAAMFGQKSWGQQFLNTADGMYMTGNTQNKIRQALVQNQNGQQQQQNKATGQIINPPGAVRLPNGKVVIRSKSGVEFDVELFDADAHVGTRAGNGGSSGGSSNPAGGGNSTGQKTLHKEETDIAIEQNGQSTTSQHGQFYTAQKKGSDSTSYYNDKTISTQVTDSHAHLRTAGNRIFTDKEGCWSTVPIQQKKDSYCKE